ncbi:MULTISPECIES: AraC family transcriptional regulator [unclassified Marinobacter]|uniref:AraC family transcriptional regulator n=1 Tax=unclassified Marinobacter TaxID=83889 RepID=UPI0026E2FB62|nr:MULTISPECIES: AraC family transcriptional regulator [unclassified Marinobacter]MDO6440626.1 AraC family transcriptional regulator [Marinobacter sp. 2_MG-2023]MDO6823454.1 AraC family transcriptional regulator [Marinobacter sp. 1_MG-2023]
MTDFFKTLLAGACVAMMLFMSAAVHAESGTAEDSQAVAERVEDLKKKVIGLNRDLFILEEDLLFPASTQFAVFLSVDAGEFLKLDAVKLKVNGDIVASHLYTDRQVSALERGGMQRLFIGNLKTGTHEVTAFVEGIGPDNRAYKQAASLAFEKGTDTAALEIRIQDRSSDYQPMVSIVEWE